MESANKTSNLGFPTTSFSSFLVIPNGNSSDEYENELEGRIKPKSSPLPRRRSSDSSDDSEPEPLPTRPRKVSFADAFGLSLVSVKEFDHRDLSSPAGLEALEGTLVRDSEEYVLTSLFTVPSSPEELLGKIRDQKCELEAVELLPGTTTLRGIVRVLNISFDKMVYVRTSLDGWATHFDLLAEFVPGSSDGETDRFMFKITLIPPFQKGGAKVEFCLRYEIPGSMFWANNNGMNYILFCNKRGGRDGKDNQLEENKPKNKKSCLKAISKDSSIERTSSILATEERAGIPKPKQEVVVTTETSTTNSEGLLEEGRRRAMVSNTADFSWRSRRRAARLARMRNPLQQNDEEDEEGSSSGQDIERRGTTEMPLDTITTPHWATTSNLPGMPNANRSNGAEKEQNHKLLLPLSLNSNRDDKRLFFPDKSDSRSERNSNKESISPKEGDAASYRSEERTSTPGRRESWNTTVNSGDTWAHNIMTAPTDGVSLKAAFDSAAYLEEDTTGWSEFLSGTPTICPNTENLPTNDISAKAGEFSQCNITGQRDLGKDLDNWPTVKEDLESDQTPENRDSEKEMGGAVHHGLCTESASVWQRFPFDSYLTAETQKESWDVSQESTSDDLLKTSTDPPSHNEPDSSQDNNLLNFSQTPQGTGDADTDVMVDEDTGHKAGQDRDQQSINNGDSFARVADLAATSAGTDRWTAVTDMAAAQQSQRLLPASGIPHDEPDNSCASSEIDTGIDGSMYDLFRSRMTFAHAVRGNEGNVKDRDEELSRNRADEDELNKHVEGLYEVEEEASMGNKNSQHDNEGAHVDETKDLPVKSKEVALGEMVDDTAADNREDLPEEEDMDYNEDLDDEEDVSVENEEDSCDEVNEDFYGQGELPLSKEEELQKTSKDVLMLTKDYRLEKEDMSVETEEDLEVAQILGLHKTLAGDKKTLSVKMEELDDKKTRWDMEAYLHKKQNKECTKKGKGAQCNEEEDRHNKIQVDISEGGKVFREKFKECGETREGLHWQKEGSVDDGSGGGTLATDFQKGRETEPNTPGITRNDNTSPSVSLLRIRSSASKPEFPREHGEAREVPNSSQADSDPVEEQVYCSTVHLPPVGKVENVARNYISCWWTSLSHNVWRVLLYAFLCLVFLITAYYYDFLACFVFYLITIYWFCFHGENGIEQAQGR